MALTPQEQLRQVLGESLPEGGSDGDTLFTDEEIKNLLEEAGGNPDRAAYQGWRVKAARLSNLVDTTEGNAQRKMSQLMSNAERMIRLYSRSSGPNTTGRSRVGRITRSRVGEP